MSLQTTLIIKKGACQTVSYQAMGKEVPGRLTAAHAVSNQCCNWLLEWMQKWQCASSFDFDCSLA